MIGKKLGKYLIEAELGRGGMGVVYRALQLSLDRTVAIKVLAQSLIGDHEGVTRFQGEARAIARLNHPGIVQVFDIEQEGDVLYLVMEFVDGEPLDVLLTRMVLPEGRILKIVADIADALHFAHEKGVVHRDVKPANVLMTRDGRPKVADFGLAYLIDREGGPTKTGFLVGSPSYMSPEQAMGKKVDRRSDVYSLGVVLFRMLTGRVPFIAESSHAILFKQVQEAPPDPIELNKGISVGVRNVVLKALAKHADERYPTMAALRDALLVCAGERPAPEEPSPALGAPPAGEAAEGARGDEPTPFSPGRTSGSRAAVSAARPPTPMPRPLSGASDVSEEPTSVTASMPPGARPRPDATPASAVAAGARPAAGPAAVPAKAPAPAAGPSPKVVVGLVAAVFAVVVVGGVALWRSGVLGGKAEPTPVPQPTAAVPAVPTAVPPVAPTAAPIPTLSVALATPAPEPTLALQTRPTAGEVAARPTPKAKKTPEQVVAELRPTVGAVPGGKRPYCVSFGPVAFAQGKTSGFAPGFSVDGGPAERAARPDSGKITIVFEVEPSEPVEGEYFQVKANLANNGMTDLKLNGVEENLPGSFTSFKRFTTFPYPPVVRTGQSEPVYAYQADKLEGTFVKTVRVIDKTGDSWSRTVEIRPCQ